MKLSVTKDLTALRVAVNARIDAAAEVARIRPDRLTPGDGQQQEYRETLREARLYQDDPAPAEADYPMLVAERDAQVESGANPSATLGSVASEVIAEVVGWNTVGQAIKKERRKGKMMVAQAVTPAAIESAADAAVAAIEAI